MGGVIAGGVVVEDEAFHVGIADGIAGTGYLSSDVGKLVIRVGVEVLNVTGVRTDGDVGSTLVDCVVPLIAVESVDSSIVTLEEPEHVIERAVFEHKHDESFNLSWHASRTS